MKSDRDIAYGMFGGVPARKHSKKAHKKTPKYLKKSYGLDAGLDLSKISNGGGFRASGMGGGFSIKGPSMKVPTEQYYKKGNKRGRGKSELEQSIAGIQASARGFETAIRGHKRQLTDTDAIIKRAKEIKKLDKKTKERVEALSTINEYEAKIKQRKAEQKKYGISKVERLKHRLAIGKTDYN